MNKVNKELYVGLFMIAGLLSVAFLFYKIGEVKLNRETYPVYGYFTSVSGLRQGARVEMAGVSIGTVSAVLLDRERFLAKVEFQIQKGIELPEDIIASVKTSGIIGEKYIDIAPGGADYILEPGDVITNTESSLDIESLVRKFIFSEDKP